MIFAISADAAMTPEKPSNPAIRAIIKNVTTHPSIPLPPFRLSAVDDKNLLNKFIKMETTNKIKNMIKMILAISADVVITPVNPNIPAMIAMMRNVRAQANILFIPCVEKDIRSCYIYI